VKPSRQDLHEAFTRRLAGRSTVAVMNAEGTTGRAKRSIAYGRLYFWYILLATLDLVTTVIILNLGGREVNSIANAALQAAGPTGLLLLKYASVALVVCICEFIATRKPGLGRMVAIAAIALSAFPVAVGWAQLATH
jgi:hypothetical protein